MSLKKLSKRWGYDSISDYTDRITGDENVKYYIGFKAFTHKGKTIIPVTLTQIQETQHTGGTKTKIKKHILGRDRVIYTLGRKQFVKYKNEYISLKDARNAK